jgi:hypothetical protein
VATNSVRILIADSFLILAGFAVYLPDPDGLVGLPTVPVRACFVSFADVRGIRHGIEVQAESLYEAVVLAVRAFRQDPWLERLGPATVIDVEIREPGMKHSLSLQQVESWLAGARRIRTRPRRRRS